MHTTLCIAALAGIAYSAPQLINLDAIAEDPAPVLVKAPVNVVTDTPPDVPAAAVVPLTSVAAKKRDLDAEKRDGDCSPYKTGSGPVPSPDTPEAFQSDPDFASMAQNAPTPDGYALVFDNLGASLQAANYMGLYTLDSYDTLTCASKCDQADGCQAFNVYLERDPTLNANNQLCPNPPSTTNYRCTLWGAPVCKEEATNSGQYQAQFHVVIAGSNAYNKAAPPPAVNGYTGPQELGGAINAPTSSGSYMGYQYFPFSQSQGYDPQTCADACDAQTAYDSRHPAADGSFMSCVFFNAYVLSKNAIPQGLYCSMYNQTWGPSYGTNYGQYRGSDRYTVSESYSYSKNLKSGQQSSSSASSSAKALSSTSSALPSSSVTVVPSQTPSSTSGGTSSQVTSATSSTAPRTTSTSGPTSSQVSSTSTTPTSSATCAPSPSNNVVQNGGFECGLAPWAAAVVANSKYTISSPGDNSNFAFEFDQTGPVDPDSNMHPASVNQDLAVVVGQSYQLTYRTYFDKCDGTEGFVGLMVNHQAVQTTDACDFGAGAFKSNSYNFTATVSPTNLRFEFIVGDTDAVVKIDNVAVVPVGPLITPTATTAPSSTAPSVAPSCTPPLLQNPSFETGGLSPWTVNNQVGQVSASVTSPGSPNGGGNYAFDGYLRLPTNPYAGHVGLTLQQKLGSTCVGVNYSISIDYIFSQPPQQNEGTITFDYPGRKGAATVSTYSTPYRTWQTYNATFQGTGSANDWVSITMSASAPADYEVDNVVVKYFPGPA